MLSIAESLVAHIRSYPSVAVAFSGGVDSCVVAQAAFLALGQHAVAVTGVGAAVSQSELTDARQCSKTIGIRHLEIPTHEIDNQHYQINDGQRCFHCKSELYETIASWAKESGIAVLLSGTNADDLSDYRPGLEAAKKFAVQSPLVDLDLGKEAVRALARFWNLPVQDKPASPCLASRIAYGQSVTLERLRRIEEAEQLLKKLGFGDVRVRMHADDLARLEIPKDTFQSMISLAEEIQQKLRQLGFHYVTLDLGGRQSGSLHRTLPILSTTR